MRKNIDRWLSLHRDITAKVEAHTDRYADKFPDIVEADGTCLLANASVWTTGFWPGMLLLAYKNTGNPKILERLRSFEAIQNTMFSNLKELHHDVGFMWYLSSAEDYNYTKFEFAKENAMNAALILMSRFNPKGNFLRAWNNDDDGIVDKSGWVIIDCMLNIELLYWASKVSGDPRFRHVANAHAESTMRNFIRDDGTVKHIVSYNPETGEMIENLAGQGYSPDSSWTRGMGWAAYGYAKAYGYTGNEDYLKASQKVIDAFVRLLPDGEIPPCDFFQPAQPHYYDSSAGAIIACAMLDNARHCPDKKEYYILEAQKLLDTLTDKCADLSPDTDGILRLSTQAYHKARKNVTLIYGDYYYYEAVDKLVKILNEEDV